MFPKIVVPPKHPKMIMFSRKTNACWVPLFLETPIYVWHHFVLRLQSVLMIKNHPNLMCIQGTPGTWPAPREVASPWRQRDLFLPNFWDKEESQTTWNILKYPEISWNGEILAHSEAFIFPGRFRAIIFPDPLGHNGHNDHWHLSFTSGMQVIRIGEPGQSHPQADDGYHFEQRSWRLVGGWTNPLETYSKWESSPIFGVKIFETTTQLCHFLHAFWYVSVLQGLVINSTEWFRFGASVLSILLWSTHGFKFTATVARFLIFPISRMSFTTNLSNYWNERRVEVQSHLPLNYLAKL